MLGTIISALTGSEDPKEVATFAKQADEVSYNARLREGARKRILQKDYIILANEIENSWGL